MRLRATSLLKSTYCVYAHMHEIMKLNRSKSACRIHWARHTAHRVPACLASSGSVRWQRRVELRRYRRLPMSTATAAASSRIGALLTGGKAQRAAAYEELAAIAKSDDPDSISTAAACVAALVDCVLCADASEVDSAEAQQARILLASLMLLDPLATGVKWVEKMVAPWTAEGTSLAVMMAKGPAELTRDDVMLAACDGLPTSIMWAQGWTEVVEAAGMDMMASFPPFIAKCPHLPPAALSSDERNERLVMLALEICRDPQDASELQLAGVKQLITWCLMMRPAVCAAAVSAGIFEIGMATLRKSAPTEWLSCRTPTGLHAGNIIISILQPVLCNLDIIGHMIDTGAADAIISALQAFELGGTSNVVGSNVMFLCGGLLQIQHLNLTAPEAAPILTRLRGIPTTLQFAQMNDLANIRVVGLTTAAVCGMLTALVFGKEEDGSFEFTQEMIDCTLLYFKDTLSGALAPFFPSLPGHWFRPIMHLCISDSNKALLVKSPALLPLLLDALFLEEGHFRKGAEELAALQTDGIDSFLQIALFEPGRELLRSNRSAVDGLRALADGKALTEEGKLAACSALLAIEGVPREPEPQVEGGADESDRHVMVSCESRVAATLLSS